MISVLLNGNPAEGYAYDLFSRQVSYTWNNIGYTYYTYRGDGLRHSKGNLKHYWDNGNITLEKNGNDVIEYYRRITYHFFVQTSNGRWAECFCDGGITYLLPEQINPDQVVWDSNTWDKVYLLGEKMLLWINIIAKQYFLQSKANFQKDK